MSYNRQFPPVNLSYMGPISNHAGNGHQNQSSFLGDYTQSNLNQSYEQYIPQELVRTESKIEKDCLSEVLKTAISKQVEGYFDQKQSNIESRFRTMQNEFEKRLKKQKEFLENMDTKQLVWNYLDHKIEGLIENKI